MEKEELNNEKQDSIKLNRTSKGLTSWELKRYFDHDKTKPEEVIKQLEAIDQRLKEKFGGEQ